jgi:hypothetical protein
MKAQENNLYSLIPLDEFKAVGLGILGECLGLF